MTGAGIVGIASELGNAGSRLGAADDLEMNAGTVQQSVSIRLIDRHSWKRGPGA